MANIVLSSKNALDSGVSWYGQADASFPLTNLADGNFSKAWRYTPGTNADGNSARFAFSLNPVLRASHVAFCAHNMGEHAQIRVKAGMARLDFDATTDNPLIHDITFGGGANGTRTNEYGVMVSGACPRYEHDRRYFENGFTYSEDLSNNAWNNHSDSLTKIYPDGRTVEFPSTGGNYHLYQLLGSGLYAVAYELRAQVRLVSGDPSFALHLHDGGTAFNGATETATTDWQWFSATLTPTTAGHVNGLGGVRKMVGAGILQIRKLQISRGSSNGKYRKTTSQRRYQRIGVITEAGATNSLLHSADLTSAVWVKSAGATITTNVAVAPDGTTSMDRIAYASAGADDMSQSFAASGSSARATSFVFRPDGSTSTNSRLYIQWDTGGVAQNVTLVFNPSTGAFVSSSSVGATIRAVGVKDIGGGFYRAYVMGVGTDAANTVCRTGLFSTVVGNITAWGFQNESTYVTSYIPTTTAAVTRTVDTAVVEPVTWVPYVWNAAEGTIYHEAMVDEILSGQGLVGSRVTASSTGVDFVFTQISDNNTSVVISTAGYVGGASHWDISNTGYSRGAAHRMATRYRANDVATSFDGAAAGTDTVASLPTITGVDMMAVPAVTAYLRRLTIWPTGKSNTDLQSLATSGPSAIDYDSGWDDCLQMSMAGDVPSTWGKDYDVIKTFAARAVEWVRVELYDGAKTSSSAPFDIGRAFMGKLTLQPASNAEDGLADAWIDRTTFTETRDGRRFFNDAARIREVTFSLPHLTLAEGKVLHEMLGSGGTSSEVLYLQNPDDEAECQRTGFVGLAEKLDPLVYPLVDTRAMNFQLRKKR